MTTLQHGPQGDTMWTFTAGSIILLFILYIVKVDSFKKWVAILLYSPSTTPTVDNPNPGPVQTPQGPVAPGGATIGEGSNTPPDTPIVPGGGSVGGTILPLIKKFFGGGFIPKQ